MQSIRPWLMMALLGGLCWFQFVNHLPAHALARSFVDQFDERPVRRILFVGNSRMYANDLPHTVREMADSAGSAVRYDMVVHALPARTLDQHWREGQVHRLLGQAGLEQVIFQAASSEHMDERMVANFQSYGTAFANEAGRRRLPASIIVGWTYGPGELDKWEISAADYHLRIQNDHQQLALASGLDLINVGSVWRKMELQPAPFPLTTDGNHPSVQGTYVAALMVYAHLAGTDGSEVRHVPDGMTPDQAASIRAAVAAYLS